MKLRLHNRELDISKGFNSYSVLYKVFHLSGIKAAEEFEKIYYKCTSFDEAWSKYQKHTIEFLDSQCEKACGLLFEAGFVTVDIDAFVENYYYDYFDITPHIEPILTALELISEYSEELEFIRNVKKLDRTQWMGGGFGVTGAITGALTASALNAVGGALHGVGDLLRKSSNNQKIKKMKQQLFEKPQICQLLCNSIVLCGDGVCFALAEETHLFDCLDTISYDPDKAVVLNRNAQKYATDPDTKLDLLVESVFMDPFNAVLYEPIYREFSSISGLDEFAEYFCITENREYDRKRRINTKLFEIEKKWGNSTKDQCGKIADLTTLAQCEGLDLDNQIFEIAKKALINSSYTSQQLEEAVKLLKEHFSNEIPPIIVRVIEAMKQRYTVLRKSEEKAKLDKVPVYDLDTAVKKAIALWEYKKRYTVNIDSEISEVLQKAVSFCHEKQHILNMRDKLKCSELTQCPVASVVIQGCDRRIEMYEHESELQWHLVHLYSPDILDLVKLARSGNAVCQLWLLRSLCPDILLDESDSEDGPHVNEIKQHMLGDDADDVIESAISFLFDSPRIYSFDLFMRMRVNLLAESKGEYCDYLEVFKNCQTCPAGMYEYGKYVRQSGREEGLYAIEEAAACGYYPAITYIQKLDEQESRSLRRSALFYKVMATGQSQYNKLYNYQYNQNEDITKLSCLLAVMYGFSNGYFSAYTQGVTSISKLFEAIWRGGYATTSEAQIYKLGFHRTGKEDTNIADAIQFLEIKMQNEVPIFSFVEDWSLQDKRHNYLDQKVFLLTTKAAYWNEKEKVYSCNFKKKVFNGFWDFPKPYSTTIQKMWWQCFSITYYATMQYRPNVSTEMLEKMAMCGNPWAICRMLMSDKTSDDRRVNWLQVKSRWNQAGLFFDICPKCYQKVTEHDTFCPECGARIRGRE